MVKNKSHIEAILWSVLFGVLLIADQISKYIAVVYLKGNSSVNLIPNLFGFTYLENAGAAWGQFQDMRWFLVGITVVLISIMLWVLFSAKYNSYRVVRFSCICIIAGGIGNMIDRIVQGYVIDFIHFKAIDFPIFNIADCCVVIGAVLMLFFFFFIYKEPEEVNKEGIGNGTEDSADLGNGTEA